MAGDSTAGAPKRPPTLPARSGTPGTATPTGAFRTGAIPAQAAGSHALDGLVRFNAAPARAAEGALLACCGSRRWAQRIAAHRPYPTLDALLAAADEASYDLSGADLDEALADETSAGLPPGTPAAAHMAWDAAHAAYEARFRHAFVICLDGYRPEELLDQALAGIRSRMGNQPDEERAIAADELRRLARARLSRLVAGPGHPNSPSVLV
ncbi:2-oxo-4-hydroxy-4-carboxy-5-ureidoimidazoline decarboxylase [Streptomyces sp. NPDC049837]|uniref:2-oxo-4-hydroxy-4-carboxy-5-ureidoimidazoline decarboxylase n=1 Tax=Streptomyces sp. NPDC049837 TaxID=3155277 RepID=UPI0034473AFA